MRATQRRLVGRQVVFQTDEEVLGHLRFDVIGPGPQRVFAERLDDAVHRALVAQRADGTIHRPAKRLSDDSNTDNTFPDDTNRGGTGQLTTSPAMSRPSAEMRAESDFRDVASG